MRAPTRSQPHHAPAGPLPVRIRPVPGERTASYLIRLAAGNRCSIGTLVSLIGRVHHGSHRGRWVQVGPQSAISMNTAALHRLAIYSGIAAAHLIRALPELDHEHTQNPEPVLRVGPAKRTFLRNCPACQRRTGEAVLAPDRPPLQLACPDHDTWLVKADPLLSTHLVPEIGKAARVLLRQQRRHTAAAVTALYTQIHGYLTFEWRGLGWHSHLAKRWTARQQILRPDADHKDLYVLARTEHWSMLPETTAIITALANFSPGTPFPDAHTHHGLARSLSGALHLDRYWSIGTNDDFHPDYTFRPLHQLLAKREYKEQTADTTNQAPQAQSVRPASRLRRQNAPKYRGTKPPETVPTTWE
jgi:hypothetical protein